MHSVFFKNQTKPNQTAQGWPWARARTSSTAPAAPNSNAQLNRKLATKNGEDCPRLGPGHTDKARPTDTTTHPKQTSTNKQAQTNKHNEAAFGAFDAKSSGVMNVGMIDGEVDVSVKK